MSLRQLQLTDKQLQSCTRWVNPQGLTILPVPHTIPWYYQIAANGTAFGVEVATHPEFPFLIKVIGFTGVTPGTLVRLQWPDGRYLSNPGVDFFSFVRTGRLGRVINAQNGGKLVQPGQKIRFDLDNSAVGSTSVIELYLEGVLQVPLVKA